MRKLRVLHIITGLGSGGAEALLFRLATRESIFEHQVIALSGRDWYTPLLEQHGIKVLHLNMGSAISGVRMLGRISSLIEESGADVIQAWMYGPNLVAGLFARQYGIPVVWGIHTSTFEGVGILSRVAARVGGAFAARLADFVINCSSRSAKIHARMGYSSVAGAVIKNGYDPDEFFPDQDSRSAARRELGVAQDKFLIGTIARWNRQKDIPNLVSALALAKKDGVPFSCVMIGRGLDRFNLELKEILSDAGCQNSVQCLGERRDVQSLARAIDIHILPSCGGEAFPNVVAESMLSGTPNIVTDVGDASQMVGETGWVVAPRDPAGLAKSIGKAFAEWRCRPLRWEQRKLAARERISRNFTFDRMARSYEEIWIREIERHHSFHKNRG
jgi:glycosyltransferase involved in cell wall biosynthesis